MVSSSWRREKETGLRTEEEVDPDEGFECLETFAPFTFVDEVCMRVCLKNWVQAEREEDEHLHRWEMHAPVGMESHWKGIWRQRAVENALKARVRW